MRYWVRGVLGLALLAAAVIAFEYALWELMHTGTCASGGPYVPARECPDGTLGKALLIPSSFVTGVIGVIVYATRGERPGAAPARIGAGGIVAAWVALVVLTAALAVTAGFTSDGPDSGAAQWTGILLAVIFVGLGVVLPAGLWRAGRRH